MCHNHSVSGFSYLRWAGIFGTIYYQKKFWIALCYCLLHKTAKNGCVVIFLSTFQQTTFNVKKSISGGLNRKLVHNDVQ